MADTNTKTPDAISQDEVPKPPEGAKPPEVAEVMVVAQHKPTAYITREKVEAMVPWEYLPMELTTYGWCQVKVADYGHIVRVTNLSGKQYLTLHPKLQGGKVECFVKQIQHSLVKVDGEVKVSETLESWEKSVLVDGMFAIACVCFVVEFSPVMICLVCIFAVDAYKRALFKPDWDKYKAAMVEYKRKVKLAVNASSSLDILVRAAGRGHRFRQPTKRYACEVVRVCLLGLGFACLYCFCMRVCTCAQVCPSVPKCAHGPKRAQVCTHEELRTSSCVCQSVG